MSVSQCLDFDRVFDWAVLKIETYAHAFRNIGIIYEESIPRHVAALNTLS